MKKLIVIALALLVAGSVSASTMPTCDEGSHYEGSYVETETCERVCTRYFFHFCINYENVCTTSGNWEGSCIADVVEEEPEEEPEEETGGEVIVTAPANNSWITVRPHVTALNYNVTVDGNDVTINYLTNQFMSGYALITNVDTGLDGMVGDGKICTYHTIKANLPAGNYAVMPYAEYNLSNFTGGVKYFTID